MALQFGVVTPAKLAQVQQAVNDLSSIWVDSMRCSADPSETYPTAEFLQRCVESGGRYGVVACFDTSINKIVGVVAGKASGRLMWWAARTANGLADTLAILEGMCSKAKTLMEPGAPAPWGWVARATYRNACLTGQFAVIDPPNGVYPPGEVIQYVGP